MATLFLARIEHILSTEKIAYKRPVLIELIMKFFPDYRRILGELQHYSTSGEIDVGILTQLSNVQITELVGHLRMKDFKSVRKWVGENSDADSSKIMRDIYDGMVGIFQPKSIPPAVVLMGRYQYQAAFVVDQEINMMAFLTELMVECEFKNDAI